MKDALLMVNPNIVNMFITKLSVNKCLTANTNMVAQSNHRRLDDKTQAAFGIARVRFNEMKAVIAIDRMAHAKVKSPALIATRSCISEKFECTTVCGVIVSVSLPTYASTLTDSQSVVASCLTINHLT